MAKVTRRFSYLRLLNYYRDKLIDKNVVCIISGGNNDIARMAEINERAILYNKLKHYFIIQFPQRSGALKDFLNNVLGADDDICLFEYTKKTNRDLTTKCLNSVKDLFSSENYEGDVNVR